MADSITFESWCETQPCSKIPCGNHKACKKGWEGALEMVAHKNISGQVFYKGGVGRVFDQPDLPYPTLSDRGHRITERFIEDNEDLVTHEAMIDLYANRLKPRWYHHWLFWMVVTAFAAGFVLALWMAFKP